MSFATILASLLTGYTFVSATSSVLNHNTTFPNTTLSGNVAPTKSQSGVSLAGRMSTDISSYCSSVYNEFTHTYKSTQLATSLHPWYEGFGPTDSYGNLIGPVTSQSYYTETIIYTQYAVRAYTAKPPCCDECFMTAGTIEFFFWSDQMSTTAPLQNVLTTSVDSAGFTFTSPSVYMAFSSLVAQNMCGQVGDEWVNTTIAFDADEITTVPPITTLSLISSPTVIDDTTYTVIVSALTTQPPPAPLTYADLGQNCSQISGYLYFSDNPINAANADWVHDPCHPVIQVPDRVLSAQPAWASAKCHMPPGVGGAYDPPRILTPAVSLDIPTLSAKPASSTTGVAPQTGAPVRFAGTDAISSAMDATPSTSVVPVAIAFEVSTSSILPSMLYAVGSPSGSANEAESTGIISAAAAASPSTKQRGSTTSGDAAEIIATNSAGVAETISITSTSPAEDSSSTTPTPETVSSSTEQGDSSRSGSAAATKTASTSSAVSKRESRTLSVLFNAVIAIALARAFIS